MMDWSNDISVSPGLRRILRLYVSIGCHRHDGSPLTARDYLFADLVQLCNHLAVTHPLLAVPHQRLCRRHDERIAHRHLRPCGFKACCHLFDIAPTLASSRSASAPWTRFASRSPTG